MISHFGSMVSLQYKGNTSIKDRVTRDQWQLIRDASQAEAENLNDWRTQIAALLKRVETGKATKILLIFSNERQIKRDSGS
jgi:hypothetical protein